MGRLRIAAAALLALAILSSSLLAAGFENTGIGVKARAMGGAFRAVADDWTAALYNPAGYAWIKDNQFGGTNTFLHYRDELTPNYRLNGVYETGVFNDITLYNHHEIQDNPSGGFVLRVPWMGESVIGLSAYQRFDYNIGWELYSPLRAYNDSADFRLSHDQYRNNLDVVTFQGTLAHEFQPDKLAVGVGLQVLRADLIFKNVAFRTSPITTSPWSDEPYRKITELSQNNGDGWGFGLNFGLLYKLNPKTKFAFTGNIPFDITLDGSSTLQFVLPHITSLPNTVDPGSAAYLFASGLVPYLTGDFTAKLRLPPSAGIGLSYDVNDKLMVALDAEYTWWSRFTGFEFSYGKMAGVPIILDQPEKAAFFTANTASPVEWKNSAKVALGASYDAAAYLTALGGLSMDQSASRDFVGFIPQFIDTGTKWGFHGGLQFHVQRWDLGIAGSYINQPTLDVTSLDKNNDDLYEGFPGQYKGATYETILSFNYRF